MKIIASSSITAQQIEGKWWQISSSWAPKSLQTVTADIKSDDCFLARKRGQARRGVEKQSYHSADKDPYSQTYGLPSGHVRL